MQNSVEVLEIKLEKQEHVENELKIDETKDCWVLIYIGGSSGHEVKGVFSNEQEAVWTKETYLNHYPSHYTNKLFAIEKSVLLR